MRNLKLETIMKKYIFTLLAALAITLSSCENDFDAKIYGSLSTTNFPKTETDYELYMLECYIPFCNHWGYTFSGYNQRQWYSATGGVYKYFDACTDETAAWTLGTWGNGWTALTSANFEDFKLCGRGADDNFPNHFEKVRDVTRYTQIIKTLEEADDASLPAEKKRRLVAETRLLRGLNMYYLLHVFGPVPVIVDVNLVNDAEAEKLLARPTLDEMTQYITDDFEYAAANMVEDPGQQGRYNADYARVCLMRHYLNEGYHMQGYYQKAYDLYGQFHGHYSLYQEGENPYADQFKIANKFNCEVVMSMSCNSDATGDGKTGNFNPLSYYVTSGDWANTDDQGNHTYVYPQGGGWAQTLNISKYYYDTFEPGDLRAKTIETSYYSKSRKRWITADDLGDIWNGFAINKYPVETSTNFQGTDVPLARWADVMLMYAEADVRLHNAVSASAIRQVNEVRHRAGLADLSSDKTSSVNAFLDALLTERGHEFHYEGFRKIDMIRFGKYYTIMNAIGRTPSSEYIPLPDYAVKQAAENGITLKQYFTRDNYDGPKK